jgi:hypothetical protein
VEDLYYALFGVVCFVSVGTLGYAFVSWLFSTK